MPPIRNHTPLVGNQNNDLSESSHISSTTHSRASTPINASNRARTSWIWGHGTEVQGKHGTSWRCDYCPPPIAKVYSDATTSHAIKHLHDTHNIAETGKISISQKMISTKSEINPKILRKLISK